MLPTQRPFVEQTDDGDAATLNTGTASAWRLRASDLACWATARLVNRADAWGGYRPLHERGQEFTKTDGTVGKLGAQTTRPAPSKRGRVLLTEAVLRRHFAGHAVEHIVGLHSTSRENLSRWGGIDIDHHGASSTAPDINLAAALGWYGKLCNLGFVPLLTDSNSKGGYHLLVLFREPVPTPQVFAFLKWLVADFRFYGFPVAPESFPKQPQINPGRYGNWLRLPGRHHTREHWSRVWDGATWLDGEAAVSLLLNLAGDCPLMIPADLPAPVKPAAQRPHQAVPSAGSGNLDRRIMSYLAKLPAGLGEGQHRDDFGYTFACFLVRDLELPDGAALQWMREWDQRNGVAKGEPRLQELIANAHLYGRHAYGCGIGEPDHSTITIIPTRRPGHLIVRCPMEVY
jgi:hypothetical protein